MLASEFIEIHKPVYKATFKRFNPQKRQFVWNCVFGKDANLVNVKYHRCGTAWVKWSSSSYHGTPIKFELTQWGRAPRYPENKYVVPVMPSVTDFLSCISGDILAGMLTFEQFAGELGYNTDSRNDYKIWKKCRKFAAECTFAFPSVFLLDLKNVVD